VCAGNRRPNGKDGDGIKRPRSFVAGMEGGAGGAGAGSSSDPKTPPHTPPHLRILPGKLPKKPGSGIRRASENIIAGFSDSVRLVFFVISSVRFFPLSRTACFLPFLPRLINKIVSYFPRIGSCRNVPSEYHC
jgi:hypothetical protein